MTPLDSPAHLESLGLVDCVSLGKMGNLIHRELSQSWSNLQYHVGQGRVPVEGVMRPETQITRDPSTPETRNGSMRLVEEHHALKRSLSEGENDWNQEDKPCREALCHEKGTWLKKREAGASMPPEKAWFSQYVSKYNKLL